MKISSVVVDWRRMRLPRGEDPSPPHSPSGLRWGRESRRPRSFEVLPRRPLAPLRASSAAESGESESRCVWRAAIRVAAGGASGDRNGLEPRLPVLPPIGIPVGSGHTKTNKNVLFIQLPARKKGKIDSAVQYHLIQSNRKAKLFARLLRILKFQLQFPRAIIDRLEILQLLPFSFFNAGKSLAISSSLPGLFDSGIPLFLFSDGSQCAPMIVKLLLSRSVAQTPQTDPRISS